MTKTQSSHKELIPQRIRYMREDANMSYEELSNKTSISIGNLKKKWKPLNMENSLLLILRCSPKFFQYQSMLYFLI